ncbi:MAG: hypothetical protein U0S36_06340 [Candidatus Nanopelagicales bacterium]|jgi:hypothetical protein
MTLVVSFCGEDLPVAPGRTFVVGREGDLGLDDNPFLHRRFLQLERRHDLWWIANVGSQLSATLTDPDGLLQSWLAPGAALPLTLPRTVVAFTAGSTSYDFELLLSDAPYTQSRRLADHDPSGQTTVGRVTFTPDQFRLVLVLAEPRLRAESRGTAVLPSAAAAAERLGWTVTKFNRKLDNVCAKLAGMGVRGLHGDAERLASNRRARLVEYAVGARLVTREDLESLG